MTRLNSFDHPRGAWRLTPKILEMECVNPLAIDQISVLEVQLFPR